MNKLLLILLLSLPLVPIADKQPPTSRLMIGMLRADGTLVPFAEYGNGGWWNPWPRPRDTAESIYGESTELTHHSLSDLPEPWFKQCGKIPTPWFYRSSAGTSTMLRAIKVVQVTAHSGTNWGLLTDFPKRSSEDPLHDVIGVAVTADQNIEPVIKIEPASTEGKEIGSFIKQIFDETAEIERMRAETPPANAEFLPVPFSLSKEERAKVETSLTALYRSKSLLNGEYIYYFEAEKKYRRPPTSRDPSCNDVSLFHGWVSGDERGGLGLMDSQVMFTDCDRKGPSTMLPVATMTLNDQIFLFVREHGWEDESYTILELNKSRLHRVLQTVGA